jgi:hypothetical protein
MMLTDGITTLSLPDELDWPDEFSWRPVVQASEYALDGALIVEHATRLAGRPITLKSGEEWGFITRAQLEQLATWGANPAQALVLTLRGVTYDVVFRHTDTAIEHEMVLFEGLPIAGDYYRVTLRFLET